MNRIRALKQKQSESEHLGQAVVHTAETHEGHSQQTGYNEGDGHTLHSLGDIHYSQLLADRSEYGEGKTEAEGSAHGIDNAGEQVGLKTLGVVSALCHEDGNTKDGAVGGDERQEDAESLIQRRRHLLQDNLHHLHEGGDDEDEGNRLKVLEVVLNQKYLNQIGDDRGYGKHESHSCGHAKGRVHFLRHTEERADSEELREDDVVDEDG